LITDAKDRQRVDPEQEVTGERHGNEANSAACDTAGAHSAPILDPAIPSSAFPAHGGLQSAAMVNQR
jgi:hypothetical protein